jgi:hypothetical protein
VHEIPVGHERDGTKVPNPGGSDVGVQQIKDLRAKPHPCWDGKLKSLWD